MEMQKQGEMRILIKVKSSLDDFSRLSLSREAALECVMKHFHNRDVVVGTTGMLSRELFELRMKRGDGHERDFLTVGGMGHASSIALGIALQKPHRTVSLHLLVFLIEILLL